MLRMGCATRRHRDEPDVSSGLLPGAHVLEISQFGQFVAFLKPDGDRFPIYSESQKLFRRAYLVLFSRISIAHISQLNKHILLLHLLRNSTYNPLIPTLPHLIRPQLPHPPRIPLLLRPHNFKYVPSLFSSALFQLRTSYKLTPFLHSSPPSAPFFTIVTKAFATTSTVSGTSTPGPGCESRINSCLFIYHQPLLMSIPTKGKYTRSNMLPRIQPPHHLLPNPRLFLPRNFVRFASKHSRVIDRHLVGEYLSRQIGEAGCVEVERLFNVSWGNEEGGPFW